MEVQIVGTIRGDQLIEQGNFRVGNQDGKHGPGEAETALLHASHRFEIRQTFNRAVVLLPPIHI